MENTKEVFMRSFKKIVLLIGRKQSENIRASTGFEPVTAVITVPCSTNWAVKPHTLALRSIWYFQASSVQLLKLENLLRWSLFTFIYNRSVNMNFMYISHYFTAREDMNSTLTSLPLCVASKLSWSRIAPVSQRSRVRIPLNRWYFQASSFQMLNLENLLRLSLFTFTLVIVVPWEMQ